MILDAQHIVKNFGGLDCREPSHAPGRCRRDRRPHRAQRSGQDHLSQLRGWHIQAISGQRQLHRPGYHRRRRRGHVPQGAFEDLSDPSPIPQADRPGERHGRRPLRRRPRQPKTQPGSGQKKRCEFVEFPMDFHAPAERLNAVQLKRLDLARALACGPKLLFLGRAGFGPTPASSMP